MNYAVKSSFVNTVLESLPDVITKLKEPHAGTDRKFDDVVSEAQTAVAIVLSY